jgi:hypothetical protein
MPKLGILRDARERGKGVKTQTLTWATGLRAVRRRPALTAAAFEVVAVPDTVHGRRARLAQASTSRLGKKARRRLEPGRPVRQGSPLAGFPARIRVRWCAGLVGGRCG